VWPRELIQNPGSTVAIPSHISLVITSLFNFEEIACVTQVLLPHTTSLCEKIPESTFSGIPFFGRKIENVRVGNRDTSQHQWRFGKHIYLIGAARPIKSYYCIGAALSDAIAFSIFSIPCKCFQRTLKERFSTDGC